ncbi:MAG: EamA family transporter, partial [Rhodobacteraceae bacterium]|nr:EamA family transporter [Paracoccaceae bacterium]
LRVSSGAITLLLISYMGKYSLKILSLLHFKTAAALSLYLIGFSYAFTNLETGIGVLIQFGVVQLVMFASSFLSDQKVPKNKSIGAIIAFSGLIYLLWPSENFTLNMNASILMAIAGMAWGIYSLLGKDAVSAISATTASFVISTPICLILVILIPSGSDFSWSNTGALLAISSGSITSGMGYALWYYVLPKIPSTNAAVSQLSVPLIAAAGGMIFMQELITLKFILSCALVLGGIAITIGLSKNADN